MNCKKEKAGFMLPQKRKNIHCIQAAVANEIISRV